MNIKILYPNKDQYNVETVGSSEGTYSYTFRLSSKLKPGIYTVVAGKGNKIAIWTFSVKEQSSGDEITINQIPDKNRGDSVTISENTTFSIVSIKVLYPNGDQYNVKVLEFLKDNFHDNIGLEEAAKKVYLSPGYLNIIFKAVTGTTVYDYITKLRMEAASKLLKDSGNKIQDIANRVGYNSAQSFIRLFKKHYNMTPLEYRRSF